MRDISEVRVRIGMGCELPVCGPGRKRWERREASVQTPALRDLGRDLGRDHALFYLVYFMRFYCP